MPSSAWKKTRRPPIPTSIYSSAASDVYKRQEMDRVVRFVLRLLRFVFECVLEPHRLSLIHISEPTRLRRISYAVFCLEKNTATTDTYLHLFVGSVRCV